MTWHANLNNLILTMHKIWQIAQGNVTFFLHNLMVYFQICYFIDLDAQEHQKTTMIFWQNRKHPLLANYLTCRVLVGDMSNSK